MDVFIICTPIFFFTFPIYSHLTGMMFLRNDFVYNQVHPVAYIVKLNIEMTMADLIGKIARNRHCGIMAVGDIATGPSDLTSSDPSSGPHSGHQGWSQMTPRGYANADRNAIELESGHGRSQLYSSDGSYKRTLAHTKSPSEQQAMRRRSHPGSGSQF